MNAQTASSRSRTRDPERTRASIVDAACVEFAEKGFEGARTGAIARKAGVPQGLIYHYFDGKEDLFDAVLHSCLNPYFEATAEMLEAKEPTPAEAAIVAVARSAIIDEMTRLLREDWLAVYRSGKTLNAISLVV